LIDQVGAFLLSCKNSWVFLSCSSSLRRLDTE